MLSFLFPILVYGHHKVKRWTVAADRKQQQPKQQLLVVVEVEVVLFLVVAVVVCKSQAGIFKLYNLN